ncbi:MAG TPA: hypothetical protein VIF62_15460, partial [Labilithrix sp.]
MLRGGHALVAVVAFAAACTSFSSTSDTADGGSPDAGAPPASPVFVQANAGSASDEPTLEVALGLPVTEGNAIIVGLTIHSGATVTSV